MHAMRSWGMGAGVLASCMFLSATAMATPGFPAVMHSHLNLQYRPPCSVCHQDGVTGFGTVTTPFGAALRQRGLQAGDDASLKAALEALRAEDVDSDADGVPDIAELQAGNDPNQIGGPSLMGEDPRYGCGARMAPTSSPERLSWALAILAVAFASLRGRRGPLSRR